MSVITFLAESSALEANDDEWTRFRTMAIPLYGMWEWSFLSYRDDSIQNAQWLAIEARFETLACKNGYRHFMEENATAFSSQFVDYY